MTVDRLLNEMPIQEFYSWIAYYKMENERNNRSLNQAEERQQAGMPTEQFESNFKALMNRRGIRGH